MEGYSELLERLARIEERTQHITQQMELLRQDIRSYEHGHRQDIRDIRQQIAHAKGVAVAISTIVALGASLLPSWLKWG